MIKAKLTTTISLLCYIFLNICYDQVIAVCAPDYITIQNTCLPTDIRCGPDAFHFNGACNAVNVVPGVCATNEISLNNCCCPASCVLNCVQHNICSCCQAAFYRGNNKFGCNYYQQPPNPYQTCTSQNPPCNQPSSPCANVTNVTPLPPYYPPYTPYPSYPPVSAPNGTILIPPISQPTPPPCWVPPSQVVPTPESPYPSAPTPITTPLPLPGSSIPPGPLPPISYPPFPPYPPYSTPPPNIYPPQPINPSKPVTPPTPPLSCPSGTILMNGKCQLIYCPPGSAMHNDRCVHFECPPGLEWNGRQCITLQPIEHHLTFNHSITNYFNDTRADITLNMVNNLHVNASMQIDVGKFSSHHKDDTNFSDENNLNIWDSGEEDIPPDTSNGSDGNDKDDENNSDVDDNGFDEDISNHTTEDTSKRRCCIVISPRICKPITGTQRWSCHSRRQKLCGAICIASKIVIRAPQILYHQTKLVMPPIFYNECRYQRTSINCSPDYQGEYYDCSGCLMMLQGRQDLCSPYCYRYNCISTHRQRCSYYDQKVFCNQYKGHFGCQEMDGCFDDWC